jgi:NTE family protein
MDLGTSQAERSPSDTDGHTDAATPANGTRSGRRRLVGPLTVRRQPTSMAVLLVAAFGAFLTFLDSTIVNIAFPNIQKSFPGSSTPTTSSLRRSGQARRLAWAH